MQTELRAIYVGRDHVDALDALVDLLGQNRELPAATQAAIRTMLTALRVHLEEGDLSSAWSEVTVVARDEVGVTPTSPWPHDPQVDCVTVEFRDRQATITASSQSWLPHSARRVRLGASRQITDVRAAARALEGLADDLNVEAGRSLVVSLADVRAALRPRQLGDLAARLFDDRLDPQAHGEIFHEQPPGFVGTVSTVDRVLDITLDEVPEPRTFE